MNIFQLASIALKNVLRNKKRSIISMFSIGISVMIIVLLFGLLGGLRNDMAQNFIDLSSGHIRIRNAKYDINERLNPLSYNIEHAEGLIQKLSAIDGVEALSPRIASSMLLYTRDNESTSVYCIGVDADREARFYQPTLVAQDTSNASSRFRNALVTTGIVEKLGMEPGETITLLSSTMQRSSNAHSFKVHGVVNFPLATMNMATVIIPLDSAQKLLQMPDRVTEILIKVEKNMMESVKADVEALLANNRGAELVIQEWDEIESAYTTMAYATVVYTIMAFVFYLLGSVSMINTTMMAVLERKREIGMLVALGMKPRRVRLLFFLESVAIGIFGALAGIVVAIGILIPLSIKGMDMSSATGGIEFGMSNIIYPTISFPTISLLFIYALLMVSLVGYLASKKSSKLDPVEALRHET